MFTASEDELELSEETKAAIEIQLRNMMEVIALEVLQTVQVAARSLRQHIDVNSDCVNEQMKAITKREINRP